MLVINELKTLTGKTFDQVFQMFQAVLPPAAYKAVPGAAGLTDIDPAYLTEALTAAFGPVGIGWWYEFNAVVVEAAGNQFLASIDTLKFYYRFIEKDAVVDSEPIISTGGSKNSERGYAVRGALTNAIGAAGAKLLWQLPVYKGEVDQRNAATLYQKAHPSAAAPAKTAPAPQPAVKPAPAPQPAVKPAAAPPAVKAAVEQPEPETDPMLTQEIDPDVVLPFGKYTGKKLSEAPRDYVEWLATGSKRAVPGTPMAECQDAAQLWLVRHPVKAS